MTPIERQILKNQIGLLSSQCFGHRMTKPLIEETKELLNPKGADEDCCDMSEQEQEAYDLGINRVKEGANEVNCNFTIFSTPEKTKAWEKGVEFAKRGRE